VNFDEYVTRSKSDLEFLRSKYKIIHDKCGKVLFEVTNEVVENMTIEQFNEYASQVQSWSEHQVEDIPVKSREIWRTSSRKQQHRNSNAFKIQVDSNSVVTTEINDHDEEDVLVVDAADPNEEVGSVTLREEEAENVELRNSDDERLLDSDEMEEEN